MEVTIDIEMIRKYLVQSFYETILPHWKIISSILLGLVMFSLWMKTSRFLGPYLSNRGLTVACLLISSPGILILVSIWGESLPNFGTYIALFAAGCTFALNVPLSNIACWFVLNMRKTIKIGEIYEIDNLIGEVLAISPQTVTMLQYVDNGEGIHTTGVVISIPNKSVLESKIVHLNSNGNMKLVDFSATFTIDSDLNEAKRLVQESCINSNVSKGNVKIITPSGSEKRIPESNDLTVNIELLDHGIQISCLCWVDSKNGRRILSSARERLLHEINRNKKLSLAYPTFRIENSYSESIIEESRGGEDHILDQLYVE